MTIIAKPRCSCSAWLRYSFPLLTQEYPYQQGTARANHKKHPPPHGAPSNAFQSMLPSPTSSHTLVSFQSVSKPYLLHRSVF